MTDPGYTARREISNAVRRMTAGLGDSRSAVYDPLRELGALHLLGAAVIHAERGAARRAREDGQSWQGIGEAMGYADTPGPGTTSVAELAFQRLASDLGSGASFDWRCPSCEGLVTDYGPEVPLPDAQQGHAGGCERYGAEVAGWDALWDELDNGNG